MRGQQPQPAAVDPSQVHAAIEQVTRGGGSSESSTMRAIDVHMDDFDPRCLCNWLRSNEELAGVRVIATSSTLTDGQSAALMQQGYDSTLHKPFTVRQLIDCIETAHAVAC